MTDTNVYMECLKSSRALSHNLNDECQLWVAPWLQSFDTTLKIVQLWVAPWLQSFDTTLKIVQEAIDGEEEDMVPFELNVLEVRTCMLPCELNVMEVRTCMVPFELNVLEVRTCMLPYELNVMEVRMCVVRLKLHALAARGVRATAAGLFPRPLGLRVWKTVPDTDQQQASSQNDGH